MNKDSEQAPEQVQIFISHSSANLEHVRLFVELISAAFNLPKSLIRCTSVPGCKLKAGADVSGQLLQEIKDAEVFIGLLTTESIESTFVLFELGARWAVGKYFAPVLGPGSSTDLLKGPLQLKHAMRTNERTDMQQLVEEMAEVLGMKLQPSNSYEAALVALLNARAAAGSNTTRQAQAGKGPIASSLKIFAARKDLFSIAQRRYANLTGLGMPIDEPSMDLTDEQLSTYGMTSILGSMTLIDQLPVSETDYAQFCKAAKQPLPEYLRSQQPRDDYPVVCVTAFEADMYAAWLKKRLPSLSEWGDAAYLQPDGAYSDYPWGNSFLPDRCNSSASNVGAITPFTKYPHSRTPSGAFDMVGNIWEWLSEYTGNNRIIIGGSWYDSPKYCKRESQISWEPSERVKDIGFRAVM
jgi:hypothetical protein